MKAILRRLLAVPLYYKIVIANVAILIAVVAIHSAVASRIAVGVAIVANAVIVRLALNVERLQKHRDKQRRLSRRALSAAEEERKRVASDLHDKTAQTLAGLLVRLSVLKNVADPDIRNDLINEAADEAAFAMDEVYRVVQALRPPAMEMLGLKGAIETYARTLANGGGDVHFDIESDDLRGALDEQSEIAVYRIMQEALSNVVRHSKATRADILMNRNGKNLNITIRDNGIGFPANEVLHDRRSLGLFGMQERASYLGGTVDIRSGSGGTTVDLKIPLSQEI
jgi:two-component system, NarL family, sensor histidine kinase UhpB